MQARLVGARPECGPATFIEVAKGRYRSRKRRSNKIIAYLAFVAILSTPALSSPDLGVLVHAIANDWLEEKKALLESRFSPARLDSGDPIAGIVVLGGHIDRTREAVRLGRRLPKATLIVTGARSDEIRLLRRQGYRPGRLLIDRQAKNTHENALYAKELASPRPGQRWLLVTSATHLPRALGTFRYQGFAVEPWPVYISHSATADLAPVVLHELLALMAYRAWGHTSSLLPSPN
jgi:uncharacterized SAM-binding protein YcdF (DUF218 family)